MSIRTMANVTSMPGRGDRSAPNFDPDVPRSLGRYIEDLELLFGRAQVVADADRKQYFCYYSPITLSDIFESLPEYRATSSYQEFIEKVKAFFPGSIQQWKYSPGDLDKLVEHQRRLGIADSTQFGAYYRDFFAVSSYLVTQNRISEAERSRAFIRGFKPELWREVHFRLQLNDPLHDQDVEWPFSDIVTATNHVLHGSTSQFLPSLSPLTATPKQSSQAGAIKHEDFASLMETLGKMIATALTTSMTQRAPRVAGTTPTTLTATTVGSLNSGNCIYCSGQHFVRNCDLVEQEVAAGLVAKNEEGRIVLATGSYVPRQVIGANLRERVLEWHR